MEKYLTDVGSVSKATARRTPQGMAHWAGTGPEGKTCGDCHFYVLLQSGFGRTPRCEKYHQLMGRWGSKRLDSATLSCRHFEQKAETDGPA